MGKIKRLPTGISQFRSISDSNLYYVDKTMYLPKMELVSDFLFFIRPRPELEFNHGYCDFFLLSDTKKFPVLQHSYVVELKYLKADASEAEAKSQWQEADAQVKKYMADETLKRMTMGTLIHGIILQFQKGKLLKMDEVK